MEYKFNIILPFLLIYFFSLNILILCELVPNGLDKTTNALNVISEQPLANDQTSALSGEEEAIAMPIYGSAEATPEDNYFEDSVTDSLEKTSDPRLKTDYVTSDETNTDLDSTNNIQNPELFSESPKSQLFVDNATETITQSPISEEPNHDSLEDLTLSTLEPIDLLYGTQMLEPKVENSTNESEIIDNNFNALNSTSLTEEMATELATTKTETVTTEEDILTAFDEPTTITPEEVITTTEEANTTIATESTTLVKTTKSPLHACLVELDDSEPQFQRYVCQSNWIVSVISVSFMLAMILFAVAKNISSHGFINLVDVRKAGVSFPQRPEIFVLICSTLPVIFSTIARPIFWPYDSHYLIFINEVRFMQARLFFDLFTRTAAVYHMVYWAFRMPIIRIIWRTFLRIKAFREVWTKEHIIEVLRDKFAPDEDDKFHNKFHNSPEYMYYYAQFLQSGMPMQYFQYMTKQGTHGGTSEAGGEGGFPDARHRNRSDGDPLTSLIIPGSESSTPNGGHQGVGGPSPKQFLNSTSLYPPSHQVSRNTSFKSSPYAGRGGTNPAFASMEATEKAFGHHLAPEDAMIALMMERRNSPSLDFRSKQMPMFSSQDLFPPISSLVDDVAEKKKKQEEVRIRPPTREFTYICKHAIPGVIYLLSLIIVFPSIFGFESFAYESTITQTYFYFDMIFIVLIPIIAITAAFYHGALAETQLNGGKKMRFRLRCYYICFVILNLPMFCLMITSSIFRITSSKEMETERYGNGIIIALTAYHANFILKATVYTTGCNCICCSNTCLSKNPGLNNCLVRMTTPRLKGQAPPAGSFAEGAEIEIEVTNEST